MKALILSLILIPTILGSLDKPYEIQWDNTGTLITPINGTRWKVDYKIVDGETEIISLEEVEESP